MSDDGMPFNSRYEGRYASGPEAYEQETVTPTTEEIAAQQLARADQRIDEAMGSFMGSIFKITCGILGILIVISVGVAILAGIWKVWIFG